MSSSAPPPAGTTPAPSPPPASTNSTSSPPPPPTTAAPPRPSPPPPITNTSSPPPARPPPPPSVSAPPPTAPSPPPPGPAPSTSPPPPQTPVASSPPPPTTPSASRPPPPKTPENSSPPPPTARPTLSPPPPPPSSTTPSTPSRRSPPPPSRSPRTPSNPPSDGGVSVGVVAAVAVAGAVAILVALTLLFLCFRRKRRRQDEVGYNAPPPPPSGPKNGTYGGGQQRRQQQQQWQQHNATPLAASPKPLPFPPTFTSSSGGSTSNYTASPHPPPSPGLVLGLSTNAFTYEELARATNGFSDANLLGQGGFGYVHKGVLPSGKEVAVKQLKAGSGQGEREFQAEVEIISRVHHRHLVSLVGYCITGTQRMLVYEFVPNNTLQFHLHGEGRPTMEWSHRLRIAIGAARGLAYLHEDCQPKIIHRDIKAANILLDFKFEAKVADFGLAKLTSDTDTHVSTRVMGTFGYLAPEYAQSGKLTDKSDVFSFGVVLLELITGHKPVDTSNTSMDESLVDWARPLLTRAIEDKNFEALADPRLNVWGPEEMSRMVACAAACVRHSARRRPRMSQIVRALEGETSLNNLSEGIRPGQSSVYSSESTDYDNVKYNEDLRRFRRMAFGGGASSDYSEPSSDFYGANPSGSSSEQTTRELEKAKMKSSRQGFSGGSVLDE